MGIVVFVCLDVLDVLIGNFLFVLECGLVCVGINLFVRFCVRCYGWLCCWLLFVVF